VVTLLCARIIAVLSNGSRSSEFLLDTQKLGAVPYFGGQGNVLRKFAHVYSVKIPGNGRAGKSVRLLIMLSLSEEERGVEAALVHEAVVSPLFHYGPPVHNVDAIDHLDR